MRIAALIVGSALALGACNPSAPVGGASGVAAGGGFPDLAGASYRAEATITGEDGQSLPLVMIRSGAKVRLEMNTGDGASTVVNNGETGEGFIITNIGGQQIAMRVTNMSDMGPLNDPAGAWNAELAATATRTGDCSGAGESGAEWTRTENGVVKAACVTADGIILRATEGGRTTWEANSIDRTPQSAALFEVPPGVEMLDLNNIPGLAEGLERARGAGR